MSKKVKVQATVDLDELADLVAAKVIRALRGDVRAAAVEVVEGLTVQLPAAMQGEAEQRPTYVLSLDEAREYLGVSRSTMFRLIDDGVVQSFKVGRRRMFRRDDLVDYVRVRVAEATP